MHKKKERSEHRLGIGPCLIPTYSVSDFSHFPPEIDFYEVWKLVGPTVEKNIDKPLWKQFCAIYLEGLNHASGVMEKAHLSESQENKAIDARFVGERNISKQDKQR